LIGIEGGVVSEVINSNHPTVERRTTNSEFSQSVGKTAVYLFDDWFDPIEGQVCEHVRGFHDRGRTG
jgi:hypothetical protein